MRSDQSAPTQQQRAASLPLRGGRTFLCQSFSKPLRLRAVLQTLALTHGDAVQQPLLAELFAHQGRDEFVYRHRWQAGMLVMWDNRCLVHAATGGYQGHRRLLHRITVGERMAA